MTGFDEDRVRELVENTFLSRRESELYVLHVEQGLTLSETAEELGITLGNVSGYLGRLKNKVERAENTSELQVG